MSKYLHKVQYYETDRMGITHHSNYVRWMEEARVEFLASMNWGYDKMEAEGIMSPVIGINCEYKKTSTFADVVSITLQIREYNGIKLILGYEMRMYGTDEIVAIGESRHCFLGEGGRPISLKKSYPELDEAIRQQITQQ